MKLSRRHASFFTLSWIASALIANPLTGCGASSGSGQDLTIGIIDYDDAEYTLDRFDRFTKYLQETLKSQVVLEPAYNESLALERIAANQWSLVFAPPGIAAIALADHQYTPLFPLLGSERDRSVLIVAADSPIKTLTQLNGQTIALGQKGSATSYYVPLYNLYGLTLASIQFEPTPQNIIELVQEKEVAAGAVAFSDLNGLDKSTYRILLDDTHELPTGAILISSTIDRVRQQRIRQMLNLIPPGIAQDAGYKPNTPVSNYQFMIKVIERVKTITSDLRQSPVKLFSD